MSLSRGVGISKILMGSSRCSGHYLPPPPHGNRVTYLSNLFWDQIFHKHQLKGEGVANSKSLLTPFLLVGRVGGFCSQSKLDFTKIFDNLASLNCRCPAHIPQAAALRGGRGELAKTPKQVSACFATTHFKSLKCIFSLLPPLSQSNQAMKFCS